MVFEHDTAAAEMLLPWREQLLSIILRITLVAGPPAVIAGVIAALNNGVPLVAVADIAAYLLIVLLYVLRKRYYQGAAFSLCVILLVLGGVLLYQVGPVSAAMILLVMPPAMAGLLLGRDAHRGIWVATGLVYGVTSLLLHLRALPWSVSFPVWYTLVGSFFVTVVAFTAAVRFLLVRLALALRTEQELKAGKEALLREVHHRVRNNLQVITSLLSLQRKQIATEETNNALEMMRGRIAAMAFSYDYLNTDGPDLLVDLFQVVEEIVRERGTVPPIRVHRINGDPATGPSLEHATVLSLVTAEVLWNCARCTDLYVETSPEVLRLVFRGTATAALETGDILRPEEPPEEPPEVLSSETQSILRALTSQIRGRIEMTASPEWVVTLTVPVTAPLTAQLTTPQQQENTTG
jgi:hypothetical protein